MLLARYLRREIIQTLLAILGILLLIFLSHRFIRYLAQASMGDLSSEFLLQLIALKFFNVLGVILPLAFFLAVLLVLGRLYVDNEVTAMSACGVGLPFLLRQITGLAIVFAVLVGILTLVVTPWAEQQQDALQTQARKLAEIAGIAPGRFQSIGQGGVFYVQELDVENTRMQHVFVALDRSHEKLIFTARSARRMIDEQGNRYLVLEDGYRYQGLPGQANYTVMQYAEHAILIHQATDEQTHQRPDSMSTLALWQAGDSRHLAELQMRLAIPLGMILLAPFAVLLSYTTPRQGRYAKLFAAILIYFIFGNLLEVAQKAVAQGDLPIWLGVWWVHLGMGMLIAVYGIYRLRYRLV